MKISFYTFGCKVNQYETEVMANRFFEAGYDVVPFSDQADIYVINSCTVTGTGDKKTKQLLRKIRRNNEDAVIALMGCFPQAFPAEAEEMKEINVIQGAKNRGNLIENVKRALLTGERIIDIEDYDKKEPFEKMKAKKFSEHTRAFVKIEDGCDRYCSYCIIPKARGPIRSKPLDELKEEIKALAENGYKEIVLVGINLSSYGKEDGYQKRLVDAVELACSVDGVERVRLGSLEPELLSEDDLKRMAAEEKFCPQFHLSVQSGCDETLKRMNRHYNSEEYMAIVNNIRSKFDNPSITTDIMVGFAGETDEEFEASLEFAKKVKFAKAHVFTYSVRKGTRAETMSGHISLRQKEKRSHIMIEEMDKLQVEFLKSQVGTVQEVLFETETDGGFTGYTKNYTKVVAQSDEPLCGKIKKVKLTSRKDDYCVGYIIA